MHVELILSGLFAFVVVVITLLIAKKRSVPDLELEHSPATTKAVAWLAGTTGGTIHDGNEILVYQDGYLLDALKDGIEAAVNTIHLESYVWTRGRTEDEFVSLLCRKAKEGVVVRLLIDSVGAIDASDHALKRLRENGVKVGLYRPVRRFNLYRANKRTHRKLLIIDGDIGFTFGHGVQDEWRGRAQDSREWRDTGVRLRGPIVYPLQVIFAQNWAETVGEPVLDQQCFRQGKPSGSVTCHTVSSSSRGGYSSVALLYSLAIAGARDEIIIQNPYFAPGAPILSCLTKAAARGVKVHLMVPGRYSDSPLLRRAGQRLYHHLLQSGVRIHLYNRTFLHQKILIVDGTWSHVGSTNLDARSLRLNAEVGVGMLACHIADELKAEFEFDCQYAHELTLEEWRSRAQYQRFIDWCAYQLRGQI